MVNTFDPWASPRLTWGQRLALQGDNGSARFDAPDANTPGKSSILGTFGDNGGWGPAKGAGQAPVAAGAPDWAKYTGGNTGASYQALLDQGFNPWANLGQYMPGGISSPNSGQRVHGTAQGGEDDLGRVWRWTNDVIRIYEQQGRPLGDRDKAQLWLANVERLRSEYGAPDNTSGPWSGSQFARFGGATGGDTWRSAGGPREAVPLVVQPDGSVGHGTPAGAGQGMRSLGHAPPQSYQVDNGPKTGTDPGKGDTPVADETGSGGGGATPIPANAEYNSFLAGNPAARTQKLYQLLGIGNPSNARSIFGGHLAGLADMFDPWSITQNTDGSQQVDDYEGLLNRFTQTLGGPGGFGKIAGSATNAMNTIDWSKLTDVEVPQVLAKLQGLQTYGMNPLIGKVYGNTLDDALAQFLGNVTDTARNDPQKAAAMRFMDYLRGNAGMRGILGLK